jgi:resorcinol 4-hydroxylase (FADH2)
LHITGSQMRQQWGLNRDGRMGDDMLLVHASRTAARPAEAIRHAEELVPALRRRVAECEALRRLPDETCADIRRTGIARILQPARYGGAEAPLVTMVDVLVPVGFACSATAWALAQFIMHNCMVARWPEAAQDRVWGPTPDALVSGIFIPLLGKAKRTDGGYLLTGRWPFVTGVDNADWCILTGMVEDDRRPPVETYFLVPTSEVRIVDTWHAIGLKGSASNDVEVDGLFVAESMAMPLQHLRGGDFPGRAANPAPLYRAPVHMTFGILLSAAVLGMAQFMFEEYLTQSGHRVALVSGREVGSYQAHQIRVAEVSASLQAADALLRADCREIMENAAADRLPTDEERSNYRCNAAFAGKLACDAAKTLWDLDGARAVYDATDIGRVFRDILVASRHITQNWDVNATEHGRARLRLPLTNPSL